MNCWLRWRAVVVGLTVYAYLPLAAAADPPVNWVDPVRPAQLWALVSGQVYRGLVFGLPLAYLPARLGAWSGETLRQFGGPWGVILALIGLWQLDRRLHAWWQATLLIAAAYSVYRDRLQYARFLRLPDPGLVRGCALAGSRSGLAG